jgi:hypothetical protein
VRFELLPPAEEDALNTATWYESQRKGLGEEFLEELDAAFADVQSDPLRFPL